MISVTRLLSGVIGPSDDLRYGSDQGATLRPGHPTRVVPAVVVWNCTRTCNLRCIHCYSDSQNVRYDNELNYKESVTLIDELAELGVAVLLFSGGEPLLRENLFELGAYAKLKGLRPVISTNGTLIDPDTAGRIREAGFAYVGVSLDGLGDTNDGFRGVPGAFGRALDGIRNCKKAGIRVGVRFTLSRRNAGDLDGIFDLVRDEGIPRLCIYHLVYAGRGAALKDEDLSHAEMRGAMELICRRTAESAEQNSGTEVLTVDNPADGVYLYLRQLAEDANRAEEIMRLLRVNGGNSSGERIACIDNTGEVHPDQFWRNHTFGNIRDRSFGEIWNDPDNELLRSLRHRTQMVKGRCRTCAYLDVCGGGLRARAEAATGDIWAAEPACYLTDEEISGQAARNQQPAGEQHGH